MFDAWTEYCPVLFLMQIIATDIAMMIKTATPAITPNTIAATLNPLLPGGIFVVEIVWVGAAVIISTASKIETFLN